MGPRLSDVPKWIGTINFKFNKVYRAAFETECRYIDVWGGRGRGGSHFGTEFFLFLITKTKYFKGYFVRQVYRDIRDSLFADFMARLKDHVDAGELSMDDFDINTHEMRIKYRPTGNIIISKGVKGEDGRTAKMKSLSGATHVLIEEADEVGEEDFDQLDLSLRTMKAERVQVIRIFNPPGKTHWLWRDYVLTDAQLGVDENGQLIKGYFKAEPISGRSVLSIWSTYKDNIRNVQPSTVEQFERYRFRKPEYYYTVVMGLISEGMKGRIFSGWVKISDQEFIDVDARSIWGQDFGSASPAGTVECKIVNNRMYVRQQNYLPLTEREIGKLYCTLGVKDEVIIGDSAEPLTIGKLRRGWQLSELSDDDRATFPGLLKGWNIFAALKGPGSVKTGIERLQDYEIYVVDSSKNLWDEYAGYRWALDKNKNPTDEPEDNNNHLIDPMRYVATGKGRYF